MKMAIEQRMPLDPAFINVDRVLPTDPNFKNSKSLGKMITELRKEGLYAPDTTTDPSLLPMDEGLKYVKMNGLKQPLIGLAPVQQEEKLIVNQLAGLQPHPMAPMPFSRKQVRYLNKQLDKVEWPPTREQTDFIANQLKVK